VPASVKHANADRIAILARAATIINRRDWEDDNHAPRTPIGYSHAAMAARKNVRLAKISATLWPLIVLHA
jgi:hypothetical protein